LLKIYIPIFHMKILLLNHNVKGEGTYIRCFNFAKHLVRFGHSVVLLTSAPNFISRPKREMIDGVEVICMPDIMGKRIRNGGLGPVDTLLRCLYVLNKKFDVVENFDHRPAVLYPTLVSKYLRSIPIVSEWTDLHGTGGSLSLRPIWLQKLIGPYENFTERKSKKIADEMIVISQWLKYMAINLGVPESHITYIPGGADIEKMMPRPKEKVRRTFGLPLDKKIIGYTAGTHYDVALLMKAIYIIQKAKNDVLFITTGTKLDKRLKSQTYDPERIIEFGFLPYEQYAELLPAVDVFLFPFTNKILNKGRWPNKIGDYMAAGRPIVSNPTGDIINLFKNHKIGLLASETPEDLAAKTLQLLANERLSSEIGIRARQTAERYFDWRLLSKKLEACFIEVRKRHKIDNEAQKFKTRYNFNE
jgi:glycosyltransferase involved in cell wall biosynthesis